MPAKSKQQYKFMKLLEHNSEAAKKYGMSQSDAKEYTSENTGSKSYSKLPDKKKPKK